MVFQDYELIHTKRVNRIRRSMDVYNHRLWLAFGSWNTVYFAGVTTVLAMHFMNTDPASLVPTRSVLTRAGFLPYFKHFGLRFYVPLLIGAAVGVNSFGDADELKKLITLRKIYEPEIESYKTELYYS